MSPQAQIDRLVAMSVKHPHMHLGNALAKIQAIVKADEIKRHLQIIAELKELGA